MTLSIRNGLQQVVDFLLAVVYFFIGVRIVLKLFLANPEAGFVQFIYRASDFLMRPFINIFPNLGFDGSRIIDTSAIIALIVYTVIGYLIIHIIENFAQTNRSYFGRYRY